MLLIDPPIDLLAVDISYFGISGSFRVVSGYSSDSPSSYSIWMSEVGFPASPSPSGKAIFSS
jgi:hypothetical protein